MEKINICFASDNGYSIHLGVAIYSLLKNLNKNYFADIYILDGGILDINKHKILQSCNKFKNKNIYFIKVDGQKFNKIHLRYLTKEAFYRLEIPNIINVEEIIYLDCDLIISGDISKLKSENKNYYIMAVPEIAMNIKYFEILKIPKNNGYFNSGVLLINVKKIKEEKLFDEVYKYLLINNNKLLAYDQDGLNAIFHSKYTKIPPKYNSIPFIFKSNRYNILGYEHNEYLEAKNNPIIIHFTGEKPWNYFCSHPKKKIYRQYRNETLFIDKKCKSEDNFNIKGLNKYILGKIYSFLITHIQEKYYYLFIHKPKKNLTALIRNFI